MKPALMFLVMVLTGVQPSLCAAVESVIDVDQGQISPNITRPQAITPHTVTPDDYPVESLPTQDVGETNIRYMVLEDGSIGAVEIFRSSGFPRLDDAAIGIVRRWRFVPATQNGRAIRVWLHAGVRFDLGPKKNAP